MIKIRCSELPRLMKCPGSRNLPTYQTDDPYSTAGREQHELALKMIKVAKFNTESLSDEELALVEPNTQVYVDYILKVKLGALIRAEVALTQTFGNFTLCGTPDFFCVEKTYNLTIVDLKNGSQDVDPFTPQMFGYAMLIASRFVSTVAYVPIKLVVIQNEEIKTMHLSRDALDEFEKMLHEKINDKTIALGDQCQFCKSKIFCNKMLNSIKTIQSAEKNDDQLFEALKVKSYMAKTLVTAHDYLQKKYPERFEKKSRKCKVWINKEYTPWIRVRMSPAATLKHSAWHKARYGKNIIIQESYNWKVKS